MPCSYIYIQERHTLNSPILFLIAMAVIVVLVMVIYGVAVARTANREIGKLNYKPNSEQAYKYYGKGGGHIGKDSCG